MTSAARTAQSAQACTPKGLPPSRGAPRRQGETTPFAGPMDAGVMATRAPQSPPWCVWAAVSGAPGRGQNHRIRDRIGSLAGKQLHAARDFTRPGPTKDRRSLDCKPRAQQARPGQATSEPMILGFPRIVDPDTPGTIVSRVLTCILGANSPTIPAPDFGRRRRNTYPISLRKRTSGAGPQTQPNATHSGR